MKIIVFLGVSVLFAYFYEANGELVPQTSEHQNKIGDRNDDFVKEAGQLHRQCDTNQTMESKTLKIACAIGQSDAARYVASGVTYKDEGVRTSSHVKDMGKNIEITLAVIVDKSNKDVKISPILRFDRQLRFIATIYRDVKITHDFSIFAPSKKEADCIQLIKKEIADRERIYHFKKIC